MISLQLAGQISTRFRRRRFANIAQTIKSLPKPASILDVGGTMKFWETMQLADDPGLSMTLLNLVQMPVTRSNVSSVVGDSRNLQYPDQSFDLVFSNSVIEHLGSYENQERMAREIRRVGKHYIVQTPNYWFPIEPHFFLLPGFQFLPLPAKAWLLERVRLGWFQPKGREQAQALAREVRLLTARELRGLFPGATLIRERFCGLTKSFTVFG